MVFGNLAKAWQLVRDQVFFLQEIERRGGVVLSIDVDAGIEFLHLFVVKQLRKGERRALQSLGARPRPRWEHLKRSGDAYG